LDPDPEPLGTRLIYYKVNRQALPDPGVLLQVLNRIGVPELNWTGTPRAGACCFGTVCLMRCEPECLQEGGRFVGEGTACSDQPPPCGSSACLTSDPLSALVWDNGLFIEMSGAGFPVTSEVTLYHVNNATGAAASDWLTLTDPTELLWNFAAAHDTSGNRFYYIGGKPGQSSAPPTVLTLDTASPALLQAHPLVPEVNIVHLAFEHLSGVLYGLSPNAGGGMNTDAGHVYFAQPLDLVSIDPDTGAVTTVAADLPPGLDHFAATLDHAGGRYIYHAFDGGLHSVDLITGATDSVTVDELLIDLKFDDDTGELYGLRAEPSLLSGNGREGWLTLGAVDLVQIDQVTGLTTVLNGSDLPTGSDNWVDAYDCNHHTYLYVSDSGQTHVLDVTTGELIASAPPPLTGRLAALD
jgi:hypothetical protein